MTTWVVHWRIESENLIAKTDAGFYYCPMPKKPITVVEAGRRGARTTLKRYGREQLREWGKRGGRPRKDGRKPKKKEAA